MADAWRLIVPLAPELILAGATLLILLWGMAFPRKDEHNLSLFVLAALTAALFALIWLVLSLGSPSAALMAPGKLPALFRIAILFAALQVVFLSHDYLASGSIPVTEYYLLILMGTLGMMITAGAGHLLILFLGIELMSLAFVLLAALIPGSARSKEASLKYLMYGLLASAFLLFGLSVLYGQYGTWDLEVMAREAARLGAGRAGALALVLVLAGFGFKLGLVPCHMWVPDVFDGSPGPVAAFLSVGPKAAVFSAAAIVLVRTFGALSSVWYPILAVMATASMIWGNVAALAQRDLKRMMAYSGIAHVGYMAIGLLAAARRPEDGLAGLGFYLFSYVFFNLGFFALIIRMEGRDGRGPSLEDVAGLGRERPLLSILFAVFLFSLAGLPPTAGFMAKFWVFLAAVRADMTWLAVMGVLNSLLGAYYYLRVVHHLFMKAPVRDIEPQAPLSVSFFALLLALFATLLLGVWPGPLVELFRGAMP